MVASTPSFLLPLSLVWRIERTDPTLEVGPTLRHAKEALEALGAAVEPADGGRELRFTGLGRSSRPAPTIAGRVVVERHGERIAVTAQGSFLQHLATLLVFTIGFRLMGFAFLISGVLGALVVLNALVSAWRLRSVARRALAFGPLKRAV